MTRADLQTLWVWLCLVASLGGGACTKTEPVAESPACCTNDAPTHAHAQGDNAQQAPREPQGTVTQSLLPSLKVMAEPTRDGVTLHVQNHGVDPVMVSTRAALLRGASEGGAKALGAYALRDACTSEPPPCVTLAPGAELIPPGWPARDGHDQCAACADCAALTPGTYQLEFKSCDGSNSAKATFELSPTP